jgi:hypothetical protein
MADQQQNTVPLYEIVETAADIISSLQIEIDRNQDLTEYNHLRSDRRNAKITRVARIWSEGGLGEAERLFDLARDQPDKFKDQKSSKKTGKSGSVSPVESARSELMAVWGQLKKDQTFHHAKMNARHQVAEAAETVKKLEREGKKLEQMLSLTLDATRDLKQALANGIRNVPLEVALAPNSNVPLATKVAAMQRTSEGVVNRLNNSKQGPTPRSLPTPSAGRMHGEDDDGRR